MVRLVAEDTGFSAGVVKHILSSWEDVALSELKQGEKVKLGQLVQLQPKIKPATKKRMGRNPRTGEEVQISAKPAKVILRARILKRAKDSLPSIQKARRAGL
jgi:nucleoid DNA-binding protein